MAKKSFILYHDQKEVIDELDDVLTTVDCTLLEEVTLEVELLFVLLHEHNANKHNVIKRRLLIIQPRNPRSYKHLFLH